MKNSKNTKTVVPIFFAVDDNYIPFLAVAMRSLSDACTKSHEYRIHILIEELSDNSRRAIKSFENENISVCFVDVRNKLKSLCQCLHIRDYYTKATYYRFFIPELFPEYDRGLYLDCDIVINRDIARLYHTPIGQNLVGAIPDEVMTDIDVFGGYAEAVLGIERNKYFNAGILVMNLKKMREINIERQFADLLSRVTYKVAQDQDYLNVICKGKVYYLSKRWNKTPMPDSDESVIPHIVHYKINFKPWRYDCIPYASYFWKCADKTEFAEYLRGIKANYSDEEKARDAAQYDGLVALAEIETEKKEREHSASLPSLCAEVV